MYIHTYKKGYTLVEVLVALSVLLISVIGPIVIATNSIKSARYAQEQAQAIFFAQEGIEAVIALRNNSIITAIRDLDLSKSWDWTSASGVNRCFNSNGCGLDFNNRDTGDPIINCGASGSNCTIRHHPGDDVPYSHAGGGEATIYRRVIRLTNVDTGGADKEVRISSTVYWDSRVHPTAGTKQVELHSSVFNLYE